MLCKSEVAEHSSSTLGKHYSDVPGHFGVIALFDRDFWGRQVELHRVACEGGRNGTNRYCDYEAHAVVTVAAPCTESNHEQFGR